VAYWSLDLHNQHASSPQIPTSDQPAWHRACSYLACCRVSVARVTWTQARVHDEHEPLRRHLERAREGSMALYEYECPACGKRFEVTVPMHEHDRLQSEPPPCPDCGKPETHQLVSLFSCKPPTG